MLRPLHLTSFKLYIQCLTFMPQHYPNVYFHDVMTVAPIGSSTVMHIILLSTLLFFPPLLSLAAPYSVGLNHAICFNAGFFQNISLFYQCS